MTTTIKVNVRDVYGKPLVYPACDTATKLLALTGLKTFTQDALRKIEALGYVIEAVARPLPRFQ